MFVTKDDGGCMERPAGKGDGGRRMQARELSLTWHNCRQKHCGPKDLIVSWNDLCPISSSASSSSDRRPCLQPGSRGGDWCMDTSADTFIVRNQMDGALVRIWGLKLENPM